LSTTPGSAPAPALESTGSFARVARRSQRWLRRHVLDPAHPIAAIEVRSRSIGVVRLAREGRRLSLGAAASLDLPEGAIRVSMTQPNVTDPAAFRDTLRSVLERAGALHVGRVALVLPDPVARLALLPGSEVAAKRRKQSEELIRFRLRKAVPFDVRDARLAFAGGGTRAADSVLVAAAYLPVIESYEEACRAVGLHAGLVELSGLALLNAAFGALPPADRLLINWDEDYVTLLLARGEWPVLVRTLAGEAAASPDEVAREVGNTILYYRERLGGTVLAQAVVRSALLPADEAIRRLEGPLGMKPEILEPWPALRAGEMSQVGQSLAGAAACLVGSRR
jgi:Tfp pilus assembly PilM family ATPase